MKGLLLKDWYMMTKYCRTYLFITAAFLAFSYIEDNILFTIYLCALCGAIPINLLSYDERSGWTQYSGTLPLTKKQIVSEKYLLGLFLIVIVMAITAVTSIIQANAMEGGLVVGEYCMTLSLMWIFATFNFSVSLPLVFRFGTEKGRILYGVMLGVLFAGIAFSLQTLLGIPQNEFAPRFLFIGLALLGIGIYALSWRLSVVLYGRREL